MAGKTVGAVGEKGLSAEAALVVAALLPHGPADLAAAVVLPAAALVAELPDAAEMLESPVVEAVLETPADAGPEVEGYIDGLDSRWHVVGWARSLLVVDERLKVELVEEGRAVASDVAMRFRGDLLEAQRGDGKYGFQLSIPARLFDGRRHGFAARVARPGAPVVLGQLDIILPSRPPKTAGVQEDTAKTSAAGLVESVLGGGVVQPAQYLETYVQDLVSALGTVAREYDFATALGLLYVHILRRRIDEGGLQTRLTRLSKHPEQLGEVVREVVYSDEAQNRLKRPSGYHLPDLEAIRAWTRLRPII